MNQNAESPASSSTVAAEVPATPTPPPMPSSHPVNYGEDTRRRSTTLATFMSIMPGLGQVYVGYYRQGFIHILVVASLITLLNMGIRDLTPLVTFFLVFFWLFNLVDAGRRAAFYNRALDGVSSEPLPDDVSLSSDRGSLIGGVVLVFFGLLFVMHTRYGMSFEIIEQWWPLALVGVGAYLIFEGLTDRRKDPVRAAS